MLLDINLGDNSKNGIEVAKDIQKLKNIPVVYLTAYSDKDTIFKAAPTNPIGYVTKPYSPETLKSTLLLACAKVFDRDNKVIQLSHGYTFDLESLALFYNKYMIKLSKKEKLMLKVLIEAENEIVSTEALEYELYPPLEYQGQANGALRGLIHRFRSKLEENILESIHSYGFRVKRLN